MSSLLKEMKDSRSNFTVAYTWLVSIENELLSEGGENAFFLEGKDDIKYYFSVFKSNKIKYSHFSLEGKQNVINASKYIKKQYRGKLKTKFFIDKDFDNLKTKDNLYVTPCYSIENLYVSDQCFEGILCCEYGLNKSIEEDQEDFQMLLSLYKERKKEFLDCIEDFMFWFYWHSSKKESDLSKFQGKLFSSKSPLIKFSLHDIEKKYDFNTLKELTGNPLDYTQKDIDEFNRIIPKDNREKFYRGKDMIEFLKEFLKTSIEEINKKNSKVFKSKNKVKFQGFNDILNSLVQYSEIPESLKEFLKI